MRSPSRFDRHTGLASILLLLLSLFNIVLGAPLPQDSGNGTSLAIRTNRPDYEDYNVDNLITLPEYVAYLQRYYPDTHKYVFYTGGSEDQAKMFCELNPGYVYYYTLYDSDASKYYRDAFPESADRTDDGEASSQAMGMVASGDIILFGGTTYRDYPQSTYTAYEYREGLRPGFANGRVRSIKHMRKWATSPDQIIATEDAQQNFHWEAGYGEGDTNNSGEPGTPVRTPSPGSSRSGSPPN